MGRVVEEKGRLLGSVGGRRGRYGRLVDPETADGVYQQGEPFCSANMRFRVIFGGSGCPDFWNGSRVI